MGNHQSNDSLYAPNDILQECKIDDDPIIRISNQWSLHHAQVSKPPGQMSVFISKEDKSSLEDFARNLRLYRHPNILKYINCTYSLQKGLYLLTEKASPLNVVQKQQSPMQICLGIQKIVSALAFLHDVAKVCHNNVTVSSVFVTPEGNWKLAGMEKVEKNGPTNDKDIRDLGALVLSLIPDPCDDGSREIVEFARTRMLTTKLHPSFTEILTLPYFAANEFVEIENFLSDLPMKSSLKRTKFFQGLVERLHKIPANLIACQLAHLLLSRMVLLDKAAVQHFLPVFLTPKGSVDEDDSDDGILPENLFKEKIIPLLLNIFHVRDMQIRLVLLRFFPNYVQLFSDVQLEEVVLPLVLLGIRDANDEMVSATLKALAVLVPRMGATKVIGKNRKKVFSDGSPSKSSRKNSQEETTKTVSSKQSNQRRQSPIGAETSDEETTIANAVHRLDFGADDWEPWEEATMENEDSSTTNDCHSESVPLHQNDEHVMMEASPVAAVGPSATIVQPKKKSDSEGDDDDFFADMTPVIKPTDRIVITKSDDKFSVRPNEEAEASPGGWSDIDDESWS